MKRGGLAGTNYSQLSSNLALHSFLLLQQSRQSKTEQLGQSPPFYGSPEQPDSTGWECSIPHSNGISPHRFSGPFNSPCDSAPCLLLSLLLLSRMHTMKAALHSGVLALGAAAAS